MIFIVLSIFFLLGAIFGSFSTVLIERWHSGKWGILLGRSECPGCHHWLSWYSLIPMISYIFQWWKCIYCKKHISFFYPLAECIMGSIFLLIGYFGYINWWDPLSGKIFVLLLLAFCTGVYILYDLRYTEIPDAILVPGIYGYLILLIVWLFIPSVETLIFDSETYWDGMPWLLRDHLMASWILYTFFYLQICIPGSIFFIKNHRYSDLLSLWISYITFPFLLVISFLSRKKELSSENENEVPAWIGWGDLRIALFIGITLGMLHGFVAFMIAYIIWSIVGVFLIIIRKKKWGSQIPFWPFLWLGWIISLVLHSEILLYMWV